MSLKNELLQKNLLFQTLRTIGVWFILYYLRFFAKLALRLTKATTIGIAGAVGKSTTRDALSAILKHENPTLVVSGNSETGIPLGLLGLSIGSYRPLDWIRVLLVAPTKITSLMNYSFIIIEMGIDGPKAPKNMTYLLTIVHPSIGILLSESAAHTANYECLTNPNNTLEENKENILSFMTNDDGLLLKTKECTYRVVAKGDSIMDSFVESLDKNIPIGYVGKEEKDDVQLTQYTVSDKGTTFHFKAKGFNTIQLAFSTMIMPEETAISFSAAILTAFHLDIPLATIEQQLSEYFTLPPGRASLFLGIKDSLIIDSSYNASGTSVLAFLKTVALLKKTTDRETVFIFGDMLELGFLTEKEHLEIAVACEGIIDHLVCVGPITKTIVLPHAEKNKEKFKSLRHFNTAKEVGIYLSSNMSQQSIVLVKGSQVLEEAIKYILKDTSDIAKLCRQNTFWEKAKKIKGTWGDV